MTKTEAARLAAMGNALRPEWPAQSILTYLTEYHGQRPYQDVALALAFIATDEATQTPKRLSEAGPWWDVCKTQRATHTPTYLGEPPVNPDDVPAYLGWLRGRRLVSVPGGAA